MQEYIKDFDEKKLKEAIRIKEAYRKGEITFEMANAQMKAHVGTLKSSELAYIEQKFDEEPEGDSIKENVNEMLSIYDGILVDEMEDKQNTLFKGHPIQNYFDENTETRKVLDAIKLLFGKTYIKNQWDELLDKLSAYKIHLSRKQNQLYAALERAGFDRPTKVMWLYDNKVRDELANFIQLINEKNGYARGQNQ